MSLYAGEHPCQGCGRTDTRPYAEGWRCPDHTPAMRRGYPEPDVARYCLRVCYCGGCIHYRRALTPITATVVDVRAVASGKRRANLDEYRAAQAEVQAARERAS